jgi:hypothetical protein
MTRALISGIAVCLLVAAAAKPVAAAPVTIDAVDSGFYFSNGTHNPAIETFLTGLLFGSEHRSFLVFDLSSITGTISAATMRLFNPEVSPFQHGYVSPDPTETLTFYDVTAAAADLTGNTAGVAGFADLGSGTLYGTTTVSAADNGTVIEIALNNAAVGDLNAATGLFAFGGALPSIDGPADQYVFGFSMVDFVADHTRQLVLEIADIPEPSLILLAGIAAAGLMVRRARRRR